MSISKNVQTIIGCDNEYDESGIAVFGAPFDSTTSFRPGTRFAPGTIRSESWGLETYSPSLDRDLNDKAVFDCGDLELPFGDTAAALDMIRDMSLRILSDGKLPFMIGGEHLVTLGAVRAAAEKYPDLHIIHLDAHTDLRDEYLGTRLSHATVIRRCHDILGDGRIYQFGIRSGEKYEFEWAKEHTFLQKFNFGGLEDAAKALRGKPVYLTLDLDVLDPSVLPGTGTPEPGGVSFWELIRALEAVTRLDIVACDMNELSPPYDPTGASTATACKILREMLLMLNGSV